MIWTGQAGRLVIRPFCSPEEDVLYVITADQIDSTNDIDRTVNQLAELNARFASALELPADQNAGDEVQAILADPGQALRMLLDLTRTGHWSVGVGMGAVRYPLPDATRKASGAAFIAAREAVEQAKRSPVRFALRAGGTPDPDRGTVDRLGAGEIESLITLLLLIRGRRSRQGWEVVDLLRSGLSQREIALRLGVSGQAVSMRIKATLWRAEAAAVPTLVRLMDILDRSLTTTEAPQ